MKVYNSISKQNTVISAFFMLMISAICLTMASYAWFSFGTKTQVDNLKLNAYVDSTLEVSLGTGIEIGKTEPNEMLADSMNGWNAKLVTYSSSLYLIGRLKPASSITGENNEIYKVDKEQYLYNVDGTVRDNSSGDTNIFSNVTKEADKINASGIIANTNDGYYVDIPVWFKCGGDSDIDVVLRAIKIYNNSSEAIEELYKTVRIVILNKDNEVIKVDNDNQAKNIIALSSSAETKPVISKDKISDNNYFYNVAEESKKGLLNNQFVIGTIKPADSENDVLKVYIRIWFEGQDSNCVISNIDEAVDVDLYFDGVNTGTNSKIDSIDDSSWK